MKKYLTSLLWISISLLGASAVGAIALNRGESINALWFITAALCIYAISYRFYSAWIVSKVLIIDENRATPALQLNDGKNYVPTNRWIVFGHHFAAIAGPGPLVGPTLAAQFGYLPGTLWILFGAVLGGAVQDMVTLFISMRHNGKSLGQIAKEQIGIIGGIAALISTFIIMTILIAVLGLVIVNAMKHSPWATATVTATIPIAIFIGIYLRYFRYGKILEASAIGVTLLAFAVVGGAWVDYHPLLRTWFDQEGLNLAWGIIIYGFLAAVLPVWLLLAPRDYLSTFIKIGTVIAIAIAIIFLQPEIKMPALTQFIDGTGPVFGGKLFPFVFITIACGAISGFHALIASGTTPKLMTSEKDIRMIGYGSMLIESFVAIMAMIAATVLDPGVYFAINSPAGIVGKEAIQAIQTINNWGFPVTLDTMNNLANQMGEATLFARTGGAPSLAVGMASIFGSAFGQAFFAIWYHFAIMFEAIFILTTLDAGTRVGRFMLQDMLGNLFPKMADTQWLPSTLITSSLVVSAWGYFLYIGVIDPNGGVNILWPLFGIANQILAAIALCVGTSYLVNSGKLKYAWITALPLVWLLIITNTAAWQKIMSDDIRVGFLSAASDLKAKLAQGLLPPEKVLVAPQLIFNQQFDACIALFLVIMLWVVVFSMIKTCMKRVISYRYAPH